MKLRAYIIQELSRIAIVKHTFSNKEGKVSAQKNDNQKIDIRRWEFGKN